MKLRVRCGSKCGGSQPRTRRIPPRLGGPTSPARSDAGPERPSQAPPAMPLLSRSRRLRSGPRRGVLLRLCITTYPFRAPALAVSWAKRAPLVQPKDSFRIARPDPLRGFWRKLAEHENEAERQDAI